jgi:hypothetical protein
MAIRPKVCGVSGWLRRMAVFAGTAVVLGAAACSGGDPGPVPPPVPPASTGSGATSSPQVSPTGTVEEQIIAQYRRFWLEALPAAQAAPPDRRKAILAPVATEPALSFFVAGIYHDEEEMGQKTYGHFIPLTETVKRRGGVALVTGCIDTSKAGKKDATTGRILTRGSGREAMLATLLRGSDSVWRISETGFPKETRC